MCKQQQTEIQQINKKTFIKIPVLCISLDVAELEKLSEPEYTDHADSADFVFPMFLGHSSRVHYFSSSIVCYIVI